MAVTPTLQVQHLRLERRTAGPGDPSTRAGPAGTERGGLVLEGLLSPARPAPVVLRSGLGAPHFLAPVPAEGPGQLEVTGRQLMSHSLGPQPGLQLLFSIMLITFTIHQLLKLALGPPFSKPSGCVPDEAPCGFESGSDAGPAEGPLGLEMKTKDPSLVAFRQPRVARPLLCSAWRCRMDEGATVSAASFGLPSTQGSLPLPSLVFLWHCIPAHTLIFPESLGMEAAVYPAAFPPGRPQGFVPAPSTPPPPNLNT